MPSLLESFQQDLSKLKQKTEQVLDIYEELEDVQKQGTTCDVDKERILTEQFFSAAVSLRQIIDQIQRVNPADIKDELGKWLLNKFLNSGEDTC